MSCLILFQIKNEVCHGSFRDQFRKDAKVFRASRGFGNAPAPLKPEILNDSLAMEPYDALSSRFERFIEIALNKFFRSVEIHEFSKSSDSLRDRLFMMQKFGLISSVEL